MILQIENHIINLDKIIRTTVKNDAIIIMYENGNIEKISNDNHSDISTTDIILSNGKKATIVVPTINDNPSSVG